MSDPVVDRTKAFVEKLSEGPLDRPAVLKEICMDLLMLQVQSAQIIQYLINAVPLPIETQKEVEEISQRMGDRVDSMLDALSRLEKGRG